MKTEGALKSKVSIYKGPIHAFKAAHCYVSLVGRKQLRFRPMAFPGTTYGVEDTAQCWSMSHIAPAPHMRCGCGFNAWYDESRALHYLAGEQKKLRSQSEVAEQISTRGYPPDSYRPTSLALLRVALFGRVVEGTLSVRDIDTFGYRAEKQRVLDLFFEKRCAVCDSDATCLAVLDIHAFPAGTFGNCFRLLPRCDEHVDDAYEIADIPTLERRNKVTIHWGYPTSE